jgi:hypothetical protein
MDFDDSDIEYRSPIADRNLSVKVHKDRNTFDNIYIDDIRYIYLGENFFDDLDDIDSEYKSKIGQNTQFIIEASKISNLNNITPEYFVDNDLLKYLININPFNTSNKIRGLNLTSGVGTKIEVYPKFYGNSFGKTELRNWLSSEDIRYSVPGSHDLNNDKYDGTDTSLANVLGNSKLLVPRLKFVNSSYNQNHENYSDINEISNLCTYTEYTNSKSVCNCEVINSKNTYVYCDPFVKRTIDGTYSYGFMCYTMITATGDTDDYDDYNSNEENSYQRGCIDLYLGTNATYYVGANVMRLRLFVTKSAEVYFIDRTKKYDTTETEIVPLRNQCENDSNDLLKSYYTGQWTRDIKSSNITRNGTNNYTWKLTLPIFSGLSFNDNITKDNYTTYYITYINPQTLNVGKSLEDPKGSTSITSITSFKNSNVINKSTEYSYGFPELVISAKGSWYLYANTMLLQPVCLKSNRGVVSQEDISDEFIIDYASTYNTASSFISNLSREMKESINKGTTDEEKGKILCSYYVGINEVQTENKSDTKLSLLFLRSTTPESLVGKDTDVDDTKYSLPLILKIPESKSTVITSNTNHDEATLRVDLTITRADKDLSGWSRLVNDNQTTAERTITFNTIYPKYDITSTGFITHKNQLTKSSSYIIASRNNIGSKIINTTIDKDSETINLSKYEAELKSAKLSDLSTYTIHNFQVVNSTSGETDEYWIMQNDNYFGIGTTKCFGYENKLGTFLSWDYEPLYKTDTINSISLKLKQYGDKWFKGYYGTNDEDIREISDITIYRKQNKLITFTSDTPSKLYGKNGGETPVLAQNSSGSEKITTTSTSQWGTTNSNSNYTGLSRTFNITLKIDDFIDKGLTLSDMFTISDVELNKNVYKYGKDWNKYIKISLTSSNVTSSTKFNNIYNGSISDDNTMLNYFNSDGSVNFDNGLGYFYDGTANTIKSIEIFDIDEENLYIKPSNASVLKDSKTIKLIVIIALPLTPEYRGLLLYAKINLIGE